MEKRKAVALRYDKDRDRAPVVVAKGIGELAEKIIETAKRHGVPIMEDKALVSAMLRLEIYEEIPPDLYKAVAKVLAFVESIKKG
ncbi:MAG: EscU/YscU/HrcU family type III secretion system export apparatus switch protein [Aquificaceae bacterium]